MNERFFHKVRKSPIFLLGLFLLLLLGTFIGLLAAEVIARLYSPSYAHILRLNHFKESERGKFARYDRLLGWDGLENAEDDFEWLDTRHHVKQNRFGYRGSEYEFQRTKKRRIVVLGDSFTWGFGVDDNDIFTSIIEKKTQFSVELVNLGVSGYGSDQEFLLWLKKGYLWKPDDIILMITIVNDPWENLVSTAYGYPKPLLKLRKDGKLVLTNTPIPQRDTPWNKPKESYKIERHGWVYSLLTKSAFANLFITVISENRTVRNYMESKHLIPSRSPGYDWEYPLYLTILDKESYKAWNLFFKIISALNSSVRAKRARLSIVIIPSIIQIYPELWNGFLKRSSIPKGIHMDKEAPNRRIVKWCQDNDIKVIDLLPALTNAGKGNPYLYYPINLHWTRDGHNVVSEILLHELQLG